MGALPRALSTAEPVVTALPLGLGGVHSHQQTFQRQGPLRHIIPQVLAPEIAARTFSQNFIIRRNPLVSQTATEPLRQDCGTAGFAQPVPPKKTLLPQMSIAAQRSQVTPRGMLLGPNPGPWGPYIGHYAAPNSPSSSGRHNRHR